MKNVPQILIFLAFTCITVSVVVVILFIDFIAHDDNGKRYTFQALETTSGYVFEIETRSFVEHVQPFSCKVMKNDETIFSPRAIGYTVNSNGIEFMLIERGERHELVAVVEKANPHVVLALYDLKNRKSGIYTSGWQEDQEMLQQLLPRFNSDNPGKPYILPRDAGDNVELKVQ